MTQELLALWNDEAGFVVSAELILIATIAVLAMVVGLAEVSNAVNQELEDVASAFGSVNQSFRYQGLTGHGGAAGGTSFHDEIDFCDGAHDIAGTVPRGESGYGHHYD